MSTARWPGRALVRRQPQREPVHAAKSRWTWTACRIPAAIPFRRGPWTRPTSGPAKWHREAALRAKAAGFDIVYVYATHGYLLSHFLSPETNTRSDEYGGSLENRVRLVRELIEDTKEAVGDRCAVAVRFSAEEGGGEDGVPVHGERREMFEMLAELPDLWDINIADYSLRDGRFALRQGRRARALHGVRQVGDLEAGGDGRPLHLAGHHGRQVKRGIVDFIGAARPSIADPVPAQEDRGRPPEDIRECIGCNVCYSGDGQSVPIRCTQNPTMNEEWRRGWHPEKIAPRARTPRC